MTAPEPLLLPVPTRLETARLLLRPFRGDDAPALHQALVESRAELLSFLWLLPWVQAQPTLELARMRCARAEAAFLLRTDLAYLAVDRTSGALIGSFGLHRTDWALPKTEVGYWLRSSQRGQGYACEGVNALVDWALGGLKAQRVELVTDEANQGSRRVAERCGFALEGITRHVLRAPDGSLRNHCIYAKLPSLSP